MQELIAAAAEKIEACLGAHPLDEYSTAFVFDANTYVLVTSFEAQEHLSLKMPVGQVAPEQFAKVAMTLLSFNALSTDGNCMRFAALPDDGAETKTIALIADVQTPRLDATDFAGFLENFVTRGEAWRSYVSAATETREGIALSGDDMIAHTNRV